jgi:PAS domain S-box-containing protein
MAVKEMEQPGWFDNELVVQFLAKLKNQLVSWVVFLFGLYYVLPRVINSVRTSYQRTRAGLETFRKISDGFDLLGTFFERFSPVILENLLRLEREMGASGVMDKVQGLEALVVSEVNTRRALMSISDRPTWEADVAGEFTFVSSSFARMLSTSQEECLGKGWLGFVQEADQARVLENWINAAVQKRHFNCYWHFKTASNTLLSVNGKAVAVTDAQHKVFKFIGVINLLQEAAIEKLPD